MEIGKSLIPPLKSRMVAVVAAVVVAVVVAGGRGGGTQCYQ